MSRPVGRSHDTEGRPRDPRPQNRRFKQLRMWRDKREDDRETDAGGGGARSGGPQEEDPETRGREEPLALQQGSGARRPGTRTWGKAAALTSLSPPRATGRLGVSRDPARPYDAVAEMHAQPETCSGCQARGQRELGRGSRLRCAVCSHEAWEASPGPRSQDWGASYRPPGRPPSRSRTWGLSRYLRLRLSATHRDC